MIKQFIKKDISIVDLNHTFFHYTSRSNLNGIYEMGLQPKVGENSLYVEKTEKVFFVEGINGILIIMDVWLRWLTSKINVCKFIYCLGTFYMRLPFCLKQIPNIVVKNSLKNEKKRNKVYINMKKILDNSVFLILDLEENIDFDYHDIDEVKNTYYESFLKLLYPKDSNLKDKKMEYWNMHAYSNKIINPNKISILESHNNDVVSIILKELIENNMEFTKQNCEFLYEYYNIYISRK